jgi:hypothetical protein
MAPELFLVIGRDNTSGGLPSTTKQSDVYSFALLALEVLYICPHGFIPSLKRLWQI